MTFNPPEMRHPAQRVRVTYTCEGESMTHQSHAETCDINNIIRRYDNTGLLPDGRGPGSYADITQLQNKTFAEQIVESRDVLDKAGKAIEAKKQKEREAAAKQAELDKKELEEYRRQAAEPSGDD